MRAVQIRSTGGPEVLELVDVEEPTPGPGEIFIRHRAIGLNFIDVYNRTGIYPMPLPARLGQEAAGVVERVGEGVTRFAIGDRAAYAGTTGSYADGAVVAANKAVHIPDDVSFEDAAASLLKGITAEYLVRRTFHVKHRDTILVHAAAGGVGSLLTQWAKSLGATVIGVVSSEQKAEKARANGCDHVLIYGRGGSISEQVRALTQGEGVPVVYDSVGKDTFEDSLDCLRPRGLMVSFGNASGAVPPMPPLRLAQGGSLYLTRPTSHHYTLTVEELDDSAGALFSVIASGQVKVEIGQRFRLDEIRQAHEALEGRRTTGSTVILP